MKRIAKLSLVVLGLVSVTLLASCGGHKSSAPSYAPSGGAHGGVHGGGYIMPSK